jgi:hypothetical protein
MAVRAPQVRRASPFDADLEILREQHAEIDSVVDDFCEALAFGYFVATPERIAGSNPRAFAHRVDYPPFGTRGRGRFLVTFLYRKADNPMRDADVFWLLTIRIAPDHLS